MSSPSTASSAELESLRREVDRIDDTIASLILERLAFAPEVAAAKPRALTPIDPVREDTVILRAVERGVPRPIAEALWRPLIGAMLARQGVKRIVAETLSLAATLSARYGGQIPVVTGDARAAAAGPDGVGAVTLLERLPEGVTPLVQLPGAGWLIGRVTG